MATVKLFGAFQDMAGWSERDIDAATLGEAMAAVAKADPRLGERLAHSSTLVILNAALLARGMRGEDHPILTTDELAFGPPVSGG